MNNAPSTPTRTAAARVRGARFVSCATGGALLLSAALAGTSAGTAAAASTATVKAHADSFVSAATPTTNRGTASYLQLDNSPVLRGYLRFTVPVPTGEHLTRALLTVTPNQSSSAITVRPAGSSWTETGLTYNNAPAPSSSTLVRSGTLTAGVPHTLDVTAALPAAGGTATLVLDNTTATSFSLRSRETTSAPTLNITTTATTTSTAPEPTPTTSTAPAPTAPADAVVSAPAALPTGPVTARVETPTLSGMTGDVADDPAIWVDPTDSSRSVVIATNKAATGGGIAVYDLAGRLLSFRPDGKFNNVDIRSGMSLGGRPTVVVTASNRTTRSLAFYRFDPSTRQLQPIAARTVVTDFEPYGLCMYRSARTGSLYAFVTQENGANTDQYELFDNAGKVDARKVRRLPVGSLSEGCVADDELGHLYLAEEDKGIWKYGAEPGAGTTRTALATVGDGRLTADVEGMALALRPGGGGHLIVSSQGSSSYAVYDRATGAWVRSFSIGGAGTVDGASQTDGLDVVTAGLGTAFPNGLLVVHDATNTGGGSSNYKYVDLAQVLGS